MDDIALALCGGGGKGAFQIGAWKALEEHGIMQNVKAIAGSSVGALNAVLFAIGNFKNAKHIWYKINNDVLLSPNTSNGDGIFSRQGLKNLLKEVQLEKIHDSEIDIYVTVLEVSTGIEYKHLNRLTVNEIIDVLLAASAMPILYDTVNFQSKEYVDGGITEYGNTPIEPLYKQGFRNIYVLSLDHNFNVFNIHKDFSVINATQYFSDCNITALQPLSDLGGLIGGTLNFSQTAVRTRMVTGYSDVNTTLNKGTVYYMKNNYSKINIEIRNKMTNMFKSAAELEEFIKVTNFSEPNLPMTTMGGTVWYENIVEISGWKVQQHKAPLMGSHYRILDNNNIRRAYVFNPEDILQALIDYENSIKFNDD